ncbi:unnamed protein product [Moneuplotes crassus]|uniref:Uncharacterized protein n=1 Tax=Euplotes crassus TaxID=5936 RepID=A0AAD1UR96_EUPCR|nr:unnamed protein product [Moneuplotes crassus]
MAKPEKDLAHQESSLIYTFYLELPFQWERIEDKKYDNENVIIKRWLRFRFSGCYGIGLFVAFQDNKKLNALKTLQNSHSNQNRVLRIESYEPTKFYLQRRYMNEIIRILPTVTQCLFLSSFKFSQKQLANIFLNISTVKKVTFFECFFEPVSITPKLRNQYLETISFEECKDLEGRDITFEDHPQRSLLARLTSRAEEPDPSVLSTILQMISSSSLSESLYRLVLKSDCTKNEIEKLMKRLIKKHKLQRIFIQCYYCQEDGTMGYDPICFPRPDRLINDPNFPQPNQQCICF